MLLGCSHVICLELTDQDNRYCQDRSRQKLWNILSNSYSVFSAISYWLCMSALLCTRRYHPGWWILGGGYSWEPSWRLATSVRKIIPKETAKIKHLVITSYSLVLSNASMSNGPQRTVSMYIQVKTKNNLPNKYARIWLMCDWYPRREKERMG